MTDYETLNENGMVECPVCDTEVREGLPPVDVLTTCDECDTQFWIRPLSLFDDPADEIPPGLLAIAQTVHGGVVVAGNFQGNTAVASARQAQAAGRMHSSSTAGQSVTVNLTGRTDDERRTRDASHQQVQNQKERR